MREQLRTMALALLLPLLAAGCSWLQSEEQEDHVRLQAALGQVQVVSTKAAPVTTLDNTLNVWAYVYPSTGSVGTPNYLCGETFSGSGSGTTYTSAQVHGAIPVGYSVKYWALTEGTVSALGGLTDLPLATTNGAPSFTYTVPTTVADQKDLLVASPYPVAGQATPPSLAFQHVLSGVQFYVTTALQSCTVNSVELSQVFGQARYTDGATPSWSDFSDAKTFGVSQAITITQGTERPLYVDANTMILIPQTLVATSRLTVKYKIVGSNTEQTAVVDIGGFSLVKGAMYKFVLGISDNAITLTVVTTGHEMDKKYDPSGMTIAWSSAEPSK